MCQACWAVADKMIQALSSQSWERLLNHISKGRPRTQKEDEAVIAWNRNCSGSDVPACCALPTSAHPGLASDPCLPCRAPGLSLPLARLRTSALLPPHLSSIREPLPSTC